MPRQRTKKRSRRPTGRRLVQRLTSGPALLAMAVGGAIAVVVVLVVMGLLTQEGGSIERIQEISAEGRTRGSPDAPVTIIEFADFQCPACKRFAATTGNRIEEEYIATDQVRLEFRNMAFLGTESWIAAKAAECANDQERFWDYHDKLFEEQRGENQGNFSPDRLKQFAGEIELDQEEFDACLDSDAHEDAIEEEVDAARETGVTSTPWFFIVVTGESSGETVKGAESFEEFQRIIERKLDEAAESS